MTNNDARYPIGKFERPTNISESQIQHWIQEIKALPAQLKETTQHLTDEQQAYSYRDNGWTIRQLVHHIADSHMNSFIRFKLALTEENPTIKPYEENDWALLEDSKLPIAPSLALIEGLHERWAYLLESLTAEQWEKQFVHPDSGTILLAENLSLYAWHGKHHLAHIKLALQRNS